jgi:hypothetical protein
MMEKCGFVLTKKEIIDFGSELASASQEIEGSITLSDSWYNTKHPCSLHDGSIKFHDIVSSCCQ